MQLCSMQPAFTAEEVNPKLEEKLIFVDKTSEANKNRCMRCGRGSKYMKMSGKCTGPKYLSENFGKWESDILGTTIR